MSTRFVPAIIAVLAVTTVMSFATFTSTTMAESQGRDLCGGTGGNGQIISVGSDEFTMARNADGSSQVVHLSGRAMIKTSAGPASLSDLKAGDRVTLVGGPNGDGSFTADAVFLCNGGQEAGASATTTVAVRNENPGAYEKVNGVITAIMIALVSLIWLGCVAFLLRKKRKSWVYILFFTIFYIYLYKVIDYTILQFQSLLLIQHFVPNLMLNGFANGTNLNLIPLATLTLGDVKTSLLNILMMMPFGFGLPFVTSFRFKKVVVTGFLFSIAIELVQFVTGFLGNTTFRVADINDVIFNTLGVAVGYLVFIVFMRIYRNIFRDRTVPTNPIFRHIYERPQVQGRGDIL